MIIRSNTAAEKEILKADEHNGQLVSEVVKQLEGRAPIAETTIGGEQELTAEQAKRLPYVMAAYMPCLLSQQMALCEIEAHVCNYWIVPPKYQVGRKDNVVYFSLCRVCYQMPNVLNVVSDELLARVAGQKKRPAILENWKH